jgi:dTDP-4-dehydrorhamnose reductase
MNVLVIGASGLVGGALFQHVPVGSRVIGTSFTQLVPSLRPLDARDRASVSRLLESGFDWVMLPAANPNVDGCERDPATTRAINVDAVATVAQTCAQTDTGLLYFSSDYVFNGAAGPYDEQAVPRPICEYGRQKLEAEQIVAGLAKYLIVRTTGVFGVERLQKNFVYRVVQTLRRGETLIVPADQIGNPTLSDDLAQVSWLLCQKGMMGVFHIAGRSHISRLEFAHLIADVFCLDASLIQGVPTATLGQPAARPLRAGLMSAKAEGLTQHTMLEAKPALETIREAVLHVLQS